MLTGDLLIRYVPNYFYFYMLVYFFFSDDTVYKWMLS